jgi:hypothetical protein
MKCIEGFEIILANEPKSQRSHDFVVVLQNPEILPLTAQPAASPLEGCDHADRKSCRVTVHVKNRWWQHSIMGYGEFSDGVRIMPSDICFASMVLSLDESLRKVPNFFCFAFPVHASWYLRHSV